MDCGVWEVLGSIVLGCWPPLADRFQFEVGDLGEEGNVEDFCGEAVANNADIVRHLERWSSSDSVVTGQTTMHKNFSRAYIERQLER